MRSVIVAVSSDLHVGSTVGLCAPNVALDDGQIVEISKAQRWLWDCWLRYWQDISTLKAKYRAEVWTVFNGDLFDGLHHGTFQLWSQNSADWKKAAVETARPATEISKHVFITRGTEVHSGNSGKLEEEFGQVIGAVKTAGGNYSDYEWFIEAAGVKLLFRHHGSMGQLPWTFPNLINRQAVIEGLKDEYDAQLFIQSHKHKFGDSGLNYDKRVIHTPAWQLGSSWLKARPQLYGDIGGIAIICRDGDYEIKKYIYRAAKGEPWKASQSRN